MNDISIVTPLLGINHGSRARNWKVCHAHLKPYLEGREWIVPEQGSSQGQRYGVTKVSVFGSRSRSQMRNIGWRASSGDIICFLDSDIVMRPECWKNAFKECLKYDVYSPYRRGVKLGRVQTSQRIDEIVHGTWRFNLPPATTWNLCGGIVFIRREVLEEIDGWDERFDGWGYEDIALEKQLKGKFRYALGKSIPIHLHHQTSRGRNADSKRTKSLYRREYACKGYREITARRAAHKARTRSTPMISSDESVTAVIGCYGRPQNLKKQMDAIKRQTHKPSDIMVWQNAGPGAFDQAQFAGTSHAYCSKNLGVWARFAYALNARTEFVCVFDDDTIPGQRWFENCIETMKTHEGLLGTAGVRFQTEKSYYPCEAWGWKQSHDLPKQVDIIGHAWFFRRSWLSHYWGEMPHRLHDTLCGEDIHFSYTLQKAGIPTYVPPHPEDDRSLWGSIEGGLGSEGPALWLNKKTHDNIKQALPAYCKKGFKLLCSP